jgi:gluconokinase
MGVAGSGKTTIGTMLADALGCPFLDADSLHAKESIEQMRRGVPLDDARRAPWLAAIRARMVDARDRQHSLVVACSALKESYRAFLGEGLPTTWIYLKGPEDLIRSRLENRMNHFASADLLASQVDVLEEPDDAIVVDISDPPAVIVSRILERLAKA